MKVNTLGVPFVAQRLMNPTSTMRMRVRSLASLSGLRTWCWRDVVWDVAQIPRCCGCGTAVVAPIGPLAWEIPYAPCVALKNKTKQKNKKEKVNPL